MSPLYFSLSPNETSPVEELRVVLEYLGNSLQFILI